MTKKMRLTFLLSCVACIILLVGCGTASSEKSSGKDIEKDNVREPIKVLSFSEMHVVTESGTGFLGVRYATFEITGSVTNNTDSPVNIDNFPVLVGGDDEVSVEMTQEKLLPGETCNVRWNSRLIIEDGYLPEQAFSGNVEFLGLDGCQKKLNEQLQDICADYAAADASREAEREAKKQAEAEEAQKRDEQKAALEACVGMTAKEALEVAKTTQYSPRFEDSVWENVTNDVLNDGDASKTQVTKVRVIDEGWFSDAEVIFTLDYTNPVTQKKNDDKALLSTCVGMTAGEAYDIAMSTNYPPTFVDCNGSDVTDLIPSSIVAAEAPVMEVSVTDGGWFSEAGVTFTLDFFNPDTQAERESATGTNSYSGQPTSSRGKTPTRNTEPSKYEYAYVKRGPNYDLYYLIDFDEMTATYFSTQGSPMVLPCSGDLENGLTIDYADEGFQEYLQYKRSGDESVVILTDAFGFEWEYTKVSVTQAEAALASVS